ncbi:hemerythrin domain-containing protein [Sulfitobacter aestuariivivens]|uniref:Hemerythrin domain-containing protein n=1 Tax=Sulfitobacter aestuariivivens TaxID=2766981 RepID=A0A927HH04_9RHOB|nr:hemerythrin domain-containing protein [Sulfitobacter aestuariivivens]MBD3665994.1 hemerythrin domain-containing protein [Sulfitobacter aestuariivivens]
MSDPLRDVPLADLTVDSTKRPDRPRFAQADDAQRGPGRHLAAIHRHYLMDLSRIAQVLHRIKAGDAPPAELVQIVLNAEMAQNFRAFGTLCGQECHVLTMHHNIEEQSIFPQLHARGSDAMRAVVDRLRAEHKVVHELLERLAAVSHTLTATPDAATFGEATAIFEQLVKVVKSHFHYEETALEEALGVYGVMV